MKKNIILIISLIAIDQIIKLLVFKFLEPTGSVTLINGVISLTYLENTGAAFGLWNNRWMLIGINLLILFTIIKLVSSKKYEFTNTVKLAYSLVLAGGTTNLIDRIFRGFVIDYIDISELFYYPVFNFADICIILGIIIVMINILIKTVEKQEQRYEGIPDNSNK